MVTLKTELFKHADKTFYHGTTSPFNRFSISSDIGFHFGTLKSATDRLKSIGFAPADIHIQRATPIKRTHPHVKAYDILTSGVANSSTERLFAVIASRIAHPKQDLLAVIEAMPHAEQSDLFSEYHHQALSPHFIHHLVQSNQKEQYRLNYNDRWVSTTHTQEDAALIAQQLKSEHVKKATLALDHVIRLPDLGLWSARDIAAHLPLAEQDKQLFWSQAGEIAQYAFLKDWLITRGINGIVYENVVEHAGVDSYIVLRSEDINLHQTPYPHPHPKLSELADTLNQQYTDNATRLEDAQLIKMMSDTLQHEWEKVEDWLQFRAEITIPAAIWDRVVASNLRSLSVIPKLNTELTSPPEMQPASRHAQRLKV